VDVRFRRADDSQPFGSCRFQVRLHVAAGINHDRFAAALAADQVGGVCERFVIEILQQHDGYFR